MFRATMCSSSGADDWVVFRRHVLVLCRDTTTQYQHVPAKHYSVVSSWRWAHSCPKHVEQLVKEKIKDNTKVTSIWFLIHTELQSYFVCNMTFAHSFGCSATHKFLHKFPDIHKRVLFCFSSSVFIFSQLRCFPFHFDGWLRQYCRLQERPFCSANESATRTTCHIKNQRMIQTSTTKISVPHYKLTFASPNSRI